MSRRTDPAGRAEPSAGAGPGGPVPVTPERLPAYLAGLLSEATALVGLPQHPLRVLIDGAPAAGAATLADELVAPLRLAGLPALRVSAEWFLRPASVRLEPGRTDPDAYYSLWLDAAALRREVLVPLGPGGTGEYLPTLRDPNTDRATRAGYVPAPPSSVLLLDGTLLLGQGLDADFTVHLHLSPAALARRTPDADRWTLPAYRRYDAEVSPTTRADVTVHLNDPRHPAIAPAPAPARR